MYIYTVGQGSFISSVSSNVVHLIGISTEVFSKRNNCYLLLESYKTCIISICGQTVDLWHLVHELAIRI